VETIALCDVAGKLEFVRPKCIALSGRQYTGLGFDLGLYGTGGGCQSIKVAIPLPPGFQWWMRTKSRKDGVRPVVGDMCFGLISLI